MIFECRFGIDEEVYYLTNTNYSEYYVKKGKVTGVKFYKRLTFVECDDKSCDISDVWKTKEEVIENYKNSFNKYNKRNDKTLIEFVGQKE